MTLRVPFGPSPSAPRLSAPRSGQAAARLRRSQKPGRLAAAVLAVLGSIATAPVARAEPSGVSAPLGVTTPGPIRQLFLDPILADARPIAQPSFQLRLESANSWSVPATFHRGGDVMVVQSDVQADSIVFGATIPWSSIGRDPPASDWRRRVATTVGWRLTAFWGGFEDGLIEGWHGLVQSTNFLRQNYPRNEIHLRMTDGSGTGPLNIHSNRIAWGDLVVGAHALLASGGTSRATGARPGDEAWAVATRIDLKLPTGALSRAGGSGGVDAALSLLASIELAPWIVVHGRTSASLLSPIAATSALQPNTLQLGAELSVVLMAGPWALVLEDRYLSALMDDSGWAVDDQKNSDVFLSSSANALFRAHNQITVGIRRGDVTLSLSEDFTPGSNPRGSQTWFYDSNAPDVVLALTVRFR